MNIYTIILYNITYHLYTSFILDTSLLIGTKNNEIFLNLNFDCNE